MANMLPSKKIAIYNVMTDVKRVFLSIHKYSDLLILTRLQIWPNIQRVWGPLLYIMIIVAIILMTTLLNTMIQNSDVQTSCIYNPLLWLAGTTENNIFTLTIMYTTKHLFQILPNRFDLLI